MTFNINRMSPEERLGHAFKELMSGQKHNPVSTQFSSSPYAHGNTGLFADAGSEDGVFSTIMLPQRGLAGALPIMPMGTAAPEGKGGLTAERFTTLTGVTKGDVETVENMPDANCGDWPLGGTLKAAEMLSVYGRVGARVRINQNEVGRALHRGEAFNLRLLNQNNPQGPFQPSVPSPGSILHNEFGKKLYETMVPFSRFMAGKIYTSTPTNNNGDGYKETVGLDLQINTGKVDIYGQAVPAMDSVVRDFNDGLVNDANPEIARWIFSLFEYLRWNAMEQGLDDVDWVMVMHPILFDELSRIWPTEYYHESLTQLERFSNGRIMFSGQETMNFRNAMRRELTIPVGETFIRVIKDNQIAESTGGAVAPGNYSSDIYVVPMTVLNGIPVTYLEFFDQNNPEAANLDNLLGLGGNPTRTSDGGRWRWYLNARNGCIDFQFFCEPRLILRTPQLAARITDVQYRTLEHYRDWNPDSDYFFNGGATNTPEQKFYTDWSTTTPVTVGR